MRRVIARPPVLFGTGGLAKELVGWLWAEGRDVACAVSTEPFGAADYKGIAVYPRVPQGEDEFLMGVSTPELKRKLAAGKEGWIQYIHPTAVLSPLAKIGKGCVIGPYAVVTGNAVLGDFVFMHAHSFVGHDSRIGDYGCLYPKATVCGNVTLGEDCLMGAGATVLPDVNIPRGTKISAGVTVRKSIPVACVYHGEAA